VSRVSDFTVMTTPQTRPGDVLILTTDQAYRTFAVGRVVSDGQKDFHKTSDVKHVRNRANALALAQTIIAPEGRIFMWDLDGDIWSEVQPS
jgi:hypothetical protein